MRSWNFRIGVACALTVAGTTSWNIRSLSAGDRAFVPTTGDVQVQGAKVPPQLFFACDSDTHALPALLANPETIENLKQLKAGVALAIKDVTPGRADVVRRLNEARVPMIAWLVLPAQEGYYLNAGNTEAGAAWFAAFQKWTTENGLKWDAVGLDIEPNFGELGELRKHKLRLAATLLRRSFDMQRVVRAREAYAALMRTIQSDGYAVETYQFLFLADERRVHSTMLERVFEIVDARPGTPEPVEKRATGSNATAAALSTLNGEVLMIYTSFNHKADSAPVWSYGADAQAIAVGSTSGSGDAALDAKFPPLNWDEFSRDLIVASHFSRVVGVYSLEGCVRQGFLPRLRTLDWNQSVTISTESIARVKRLRFGVEGVLWTVSHLIYFVAVVILVMGYLLWRRSARRRGRPQINCSSGTTGRPGAV